MFTHVIHASMAPDATGQLAFGAGDLSTAEQSCAGVVGAHASSPSPELKSDQSGENSSM